ncbi:L-proline dehydrogenase [Flavobacteriaceae bacterium MAR_2010_188]|nr:L-proline dehydrogenase [Flavobacteriaceae bacterium MAR_2010_188]
MINSMLNALNFENTKIAFSAKSNKELRKAELLFTLLSKAWITNLAKTITNLLLSAGFPIVPLLKYTVFEQFCGGETIKDCESTIEEMYKKGQVHSILDYSVEGKQSEEFYDQALKTMLNICEYASSVREVPFLVFKPTGMGRMEIYEKISNNFLLEGPDKLEWERIKNRINSICLSIAKTDSLKIMIDAEESWMQKAIDELIQEMMLKYNKNRAVVFNTVQMYRHDRLSYLKDIYSFGKTNRIRVGIKIVRGAYMEKERERAAQIGYVSPICRDKNSTDINFNEGLSFCLNRLEVFDIFAGSHNEESCKLFSEDLEVKGINKGDNRIWFGQLYGMSDHISFNLARSGYNSAKYVPFGPIKEVIPYLFRRAEENTSVESQTSRELFYIRKEIQRRKNGRT